MRAARVLAAVLLAACGAGPATDDDFAAFWQKFSDAVARNSAADVQALTQFPFMYEGTQHDAAGFRPIYAMLFQDAERECLTTASPTEEDGSYAAFCGPYIFVFSRESGAWRFSEFAADPESVEDDLAAELPSASLGIWRFERSRAAPWIGAGDAPLTNAGLRGSTIEFAGRRVLADSPLGCEDAGYEYVITTSPDGLFQGNLPAPSDASARAAGVPSLPVVTLQVRCETGLFGYHFTGANAAVTALDNVIWTLTAEPLPATPARAVHALLVMHMGGDMAFTPALVQSKQRLLTAELGALITAYFAHPWPADEPPPINGDPFTNSQEYPTRATIAGVQEMGDSASARVLFGDGIRERPIDVVLRRMGEAWLVDDLRYEDGSTFREILKAR